ncbi:YhgE/Pip domain-containing protein [Sporosarcina sp. FSL K6-3457]|uniref:YhgE/Pip domain-containing protein n=1 Tax=Sporosarcina sp. FSL K6-3457 TaxID=2978204 RepID=UPI0030F6205E
MMNGLKALFQVRETYIGIAAAIAFQLIFFSVWMTAYDGVNDRVKNLSIGVVNEDDGMGQEIALQIQQQAPFAFKTYTSIEQAQSAMNERKIEMIIQIPASLTESIQTGSETNIIYWINQSNASLTKTMMETTAFHLHEQVNRGFYPLQKNEAASVFTQQLQQLPMQTELADAIGEAVVLTLHSIQDQPIGSAVRKTNDVDGFAANLVPLMVIISSFVGAMVMVMQHEAAASLIHERVSKWQLFFARQIINIGVAFLLPLLTTGLMGIFNISSQEHFLTIYTFQAILFWSFLSLAQVFVLAFGNLGMIFNILALSLQLVTSGVLVPTALLSDGYAKVASWLPATYGADGYYTIIFGGSASSITNNLQSLAIIIAVSLIISFGTVALKRDKKVSIMQDSSESKIIPRPIR